MPSILLSISARLGPCSACRPSRIARVSRAPGNVGVGGKIGGVHDQQYGIRVFRARPGRCHHGAVQPPARPEDARRVHEHDLGLTGHRDAAHRHARGLHLGTDNGDLGSHQGVDQRGLAGVGSADDGGKAAASGHGLHLCKQFGGGILFGLALGAALAGDGIKAHHPRFHHKMRGVIGPAALLQGINPARKILCPAPAPIPAAVSWRRACHWPVRRTCRPNSVRRNCAPPPCRRRDTARQSPPRRPRTEWRAYRGPRPIFPNWPG